MEPFIAPLKDVSDYASRDWHHYANISKEILQKRWYEPEGVGLKNALISQRFSREALQKYVGKFSGKFDLRGIDLRGLDLSGIDLSDIDFFSANFKQCDLTSTNFCGSYLSECNISGASLKWSKLDGVLLDNVDFDNKTNLLGVNLNAANFTYATLLYDLAISQQRIQQLEKYYPIFAKLLWATCDYGRSFSRYIAWVMSLVFVYAFIYWCFPQLLNASSPSGFIDYLYFSIVTFATVGYGDIAPIGVIGRVVVMSEIAIGYLMGGLLVAILAKKVIG